MYFYNTKWTLKLVLLGAWVIVLYTLYSEMLVNPSRSSPPFILTKSYNDTDDYLINSPGCSIPNYLKTYKVEEAKDVRQTCGPRVIHIKKKTDDKIVFTIDAKIRHYSSQKYTCCYQFISASKVKGKLDVRGVSYSLCTPFTNGTEIKLKKEIIFVNCNVTAKNQIIYKDAYALVKKIKMPKKNNKNKWNVLILGMDTMSRSRLYTSMPKAEEYFNKYNWLDYRAYQKVGSNTFPNVMSLLTGKKMSTIYDTCSAGMDKCNKMMIWSDFKKAKYITATGEDDLSLPDTFSKYGYVSSPTDHYLRPLFLTGEEDIGNIVCTRKKSSARHVLDYALDFAKTYKNKRFLGVFWTNSYSHGLKNIPTLIDEDIVSFFKNLYRSGVLNNTFVFFLSDHGIRFGKTRIPYNSYYEERLPMLFLKVPLRFRQMYVKEFKNMKINQKRLIVPYDIYLTFQNIIGRSNISAEACPTCSSIFKEITPYRTCADAGVDDKWCSCLQLTSNKKNDSEVANSIRLAEKNLQNKIKSIKTLRCKQCVILSIKTVLRTHTSHDPLKNTTTNVLAFTTTPGDITFEAIILKHKNNFTVLPIETISPYNTRGNCVVNRYDRGYCICKQIC